MIILINNRAVFRLIRTYLLVRKPRLTHVELLIYLF